MPATPKNSIAFTAEDRQLITLLIDTIIPAVPPKEGAAVAYWQRTGSQVVASQHVEEVIDAQPEESIKEFRQLLSLLHSPLLGVAWRGPLKPFVKLSPAQRERLLQHWAKSPLAMFRKAVASLRKIITFLYYSLAEQGTNPNWAALGYPGPLPQEKAAAANPAAPNTANTANTTEGTADAKAKPLPLTQVPANGQLHCHTLVIGSGAGGGVVAGELSASGVDVLVVEAGSYFQDHQMSQLEYQGVSQRYDSKGSLASTDGSVTVFAGIGLGGGTTINWAGSFHTPDYVLDEWATEHQAPFFKSKAFQDSLNAVAKRLNVNTDYAHHNAQNQLLKRGSERLGQQVKLIPRNEMGLTEEAFNGIGYSTFGDRYGHKQGTVKTYLADTVGQGGRLLANTRITKLLLQGNTVTGAEGLHTGANGTVQPVHIKAQRIVVSAGAVHTPALLLRSGLKHPHLGQHLTLHPTVAVSGIYSQPVRSWWGPMMSYVNDSFTQLSGNYGFKLETPPAHTGLIALAMPWLSGEQHKTAMLEAEHLANFIVLVRDRDGGTVKVDRHGTPLLSYKISDFDKQHMIMGIQEGTRIHAAAGAEKVITPHQDYQEYTKGQDLEAFLATIHRADWRTNRFSLFSAHQMGTCRLGGSLPHTP